MMDNKKEIYTSKGLVSHIKAAQTEKDELPLLQKIH